MYGMYHHSTRLTPLLSNRELKGLTLTLEKGVRYVSNKVWVERKELSDEMVLASTL
jgi:hypothetical protein